MGIDRHCRWVRRRLPLLIGGELAVVERRKVERHLIGCADCQVRRDGSTGAFTALRAFAEITPARLDAPSLWPALADQIRQSRHVAPIPAWWETPLPRAWAAVGLVMALVGLVAAPLSLLSGREPSRSARQVVELPPVELPKLVSVPSSALPKSRSLPLDAAPKNLANPSFDPTSTSSLQFNYDLDHGTPMGPGNRDPQHSY